MTFNPYRMKNKKEIVWMNAEELKKGRPCPTINCGGYLRKSRLNPGCYYCEICQKTFGGK